MPTFPFEVSLEEVLKNPEGYVDAVFSCLESEFLVMPKGEGFVEYPTFERGYEALKKATSGFLIFMIFNLIILAGAFNLLRWIWAGSVTARKTAIYLISALNMIPIWLFSRGINQVYTRPPLLFMELAGITIIFLIFFLAVRGLLNSIKVTELPCSSMLFSALSTRNLRTDLYRMMGVPVTDHFPGKLPIKAFLFAVAAFLMEGSVFYTYFTLGVKLHKTAVRFRIYEIRHPESDPVGFGIVLLIFGAMLLIGFLSTQAFLYLARRFRLRSRRLLMQSYDEQKQTDPRPPFLFLRPFRDDQITLRDAPLRWYMRIFDPGINALTIEELLVQTYADLGPIIAIGNPSDALPPIGANRQYVADNQWQEIVCSLMDNSQKIIVAVSDSQSVLWEIDTLVSVHPEMTNLPDIGVARKILSSEYQPYACGKIFRAP